MSGRLGLVGMITRIPTPPFKLLPLARRAWLYRVVTTAGPLLTFYGVVSDQAWPLWTALAATVLGTGTAALHTPRS